MSRVPARMAVMIRARAGDCCEYCRLPAMSSQAPFEVEHIIPVKHQGDSSPENLALACFHCNRHKGVSISGIDPDTGGLVRLFHPRLDVWSRHFRMKNGVLTGRTPIGAVTIDVLVMNDHLQVQLRHLWL